MYLCRLVVVAKMHRAARRGAAWRESRELDTCCCVLTDTGRPRPLSNVYFSVVDDRRTPAAAAAAELLPVSCLRGGGRQRRSPGCRRSAATGARGTLGFHRINPRAVRHYARVPTESRANNCRVSVTVERVEDCYELITVRLYIWDYCN